MYRQQEQQQQQRRVGSRLFYGEKDSSAQDALERTAAHLEKLKRLQGRQQQQRQHLPYPSNYDLNKSGDNDNDDLGDDDQEVDRLKQMYLQQSANSIKEELKRRKLSQTGRKPDLARRLAQHDLFLLQQKQQSLQELNPASVTQQQEQQKEEKQDNFVLSHFAGRRLSYAAGLALGRAGFVRPTPIQEAYLGGGSSSKNKKNQSTQSCILHAETGSGKSLAYLLPITEQAWDLQQHRRGGSSRSAQQQTKRRALILTPTRELAAQITGIASVLAPPGAVRLVPYATNLMSSGSKDRGEQGPYQAGRLDDGNSNDHATIFVGSAKAVLHSLYGDQDKWPASPTPKPLAMEFLQSISWLVLDEVDRLLLQGQKRGRSNKGAGKRHEKPAAILSAAIQRSTLGQCTVVAASATVGRPLKRELARVLGLLPNECPPVIRARAGQSEDEDDDNDLEVEDNEQSAQQGRAVTIPETVDHFFLGVNRASEGTILTGAYQLLSQISNHNQKNNNKKPHRILMVLAKSFEMSTPNTLGVLKHFKCQPEPKSLLDVLQAEGTDQMIEKHRQVSKASGVGESIKSALVSTSSSSYFEPSTNEKDGDDGYLLVTGEDTIRGLHLDGLDMVICVGRPNGPDEYTHIAGRTGRAGRHGRVISVLSHEGAQALKSWGSMLNVTFTPLSIDQLAQDVATKLLVSDNE